MSIEGLGAHPGDELKISEKPKSTAVKQPPTSPALLEESQHVDHLPIVDQLQHPDQTLNNLVDQGKAFIAEYKNKVGHLNTQEKLEFFQKGNGIACRLNELDRNAKMDFLRELKPLVDQLKESDFHSKKFIDGQDLIKAYGKIQNPSHLDHRILLKNAVEIASELKKENPSAAESFRKEIRAIDERFKTKEVEVDTPQVKKEVEVDTPEVKKQVRFAPGPAEEIPDVKKTLLQSLNEARGPLIKTKLQEIEQLETVLDPTETAHAFLIKDTLFMNKAKLNVVTEKRSFYSTTAEQFKFGQHLLTKIDPATGNEVVIANISRHEGVYTPKEMLRLIQHQLMHYTDKIKNGSFSLLEVAISEQEGDVDRTRKLFNFFNGKTIEFIDSSREFYLDGNVVYMPVIPGGKVGDTLKLTTELLVTGKGGDVSIKEAVEALRDSKAAVSVSSETGVGAVDDIINRFISKKFESKMLRHAIFSKLYSKRGVRGRLGSPLKVKDVLHMRAGLLMKAKLLMKRVGPPKSVKLTEAISNFKAVKLAAPGG